MTKDKFIAAIEQKPAFIKWASAPERKEVVGDVEKWSGVAYVNTPDGTNLTHVWFIVDAATGTATWQNQDSLEQEKNTGDKKLAALKNYMKTTFAAFFIEKLDLDNNWAEATVYTISGQDLAKSTVLVFKQGANPITHRKIV